uniref:NADH-ubiquinone oxidoreductase chain 2 n=1 Tax=Mitrella albuginosa TaxID=2970549 RepID=A0A976UF57_9CAEN|nr:NADH dehydrogenase subunit 2 [Mitrella albuginosa]UVG40733.1 NADH dehydrogenase subunit 2 [Mitrella albuginosa]
MFSSLPFGYMFLSVMGIGTLLSVSSMHWLMMWAGLEINLIGFLPLLVYQKSVSESQSAVKYFIVQALGSSFLIFGSLMSFSSSFGWDTYISGYNYSSIGFLVLICGLFIKLGLFPFHYWLPSVMAGLPWISCMLLATWQKFAPLFLLLCLTEMNHFYMVSLFICVVSIGSSLVGGVGGMNQTQTRALLAYSSIGHLGWMSFAIIHSEWTMKVYLAVYVLISISLFTSLWYSDFGNMKNIYNLKDFSFMYLSVMFLLLSLGGLPPLLGFVSKWLVVLVGTGSVWTPVVFGLILGSLMSLFYYLSLFFSMFLSSLKKSGFKNMLMTNSLVGVINIMNLVGGVFILLTNMMYSI